MSKEIKRLKLMNFAIWGIFIVMFAVASVWLYWLVQPYQLPFVKEPIQILNKDKEVRKGEPILMQIEINKPNELQPYLSAHRVDCDGGTVTEFFRSTPREVPAGKRTVISSDYFLPESLQIKVGATCNFVFNLDYRINPLKTVGATWTSEDFKVKE